MTDIIRLLWIDRQTDIMGSLAIDGQAYNNGIVVDRESCIYNGTVVDSLRRYTDGQTSKQTDNRPRRTMCT